MMGDKWTLPGREAELDELEQALDDTNASRHMLVVVRGDHGTGKTELFNTVAGRWRRRGITVLSVRFRDNVSPWDLFGARAVIDALREHYLREGDFSLEGPVDAAAALCTPRAYDSPKDRSWLLARLAEAFDRLRIGCPTVLIADDLDSVPHPALAPACLPGYLVVVACRDATRFTPDRLITLEQNLKFS